MVTREEHARLIELPGIELLEQLGSRWYRRAHELAPVRSARLAVVSEVAERFRPARRVLNHLADRYLVPPHGGWFTPPSPSRP